MYCHKNKKELIKYFFLKKYDTLYKTKINTLKVQQKRTPYLTLTNSFKVKHLFLIKKKCAKQIVPMIIGQILLLYFNLIDKSNQI